MDSEMEYGPNLPTFADLKNHLREEPLYFQVLENYLRNAAHIIEDLRAKLERQSIDDARMEVPEADLLRRTSPPPSRVFTEEPVSVLVNDEGALEEEEMAERRQMSYEPLLNEEDIDMTPRALAIVPECREVAKTREIVLRSRTIAVSVVEEERSEVVPADWEFHVPAMEGLPEKYQQLLVTPKTDPYKVIRNEGGSSTIECGLCGKRFGTLKGWRIHATKIHTQNGFCQKCGHFISVPHAASVEVIRASMELHTLEWCPKATKAVVSERATKRRRLELVGRSEEAQHYYIPDASI